MEILPIEEIKDDLEAMALLRLEIFDLQKKLDRQLTDLDLSMLRSMGTTGCEYELSKRAAKAMAMLATAQEKIRKDGMVGQLELKAGIVETLDEEQYHEKASLASFDNEKTDSKNREAKERQKEQSILFISNQMGAKMRQISLAEEDFYYYVKEMLVLWRKQEFLQQEKGKTWTAEENTPKTDQPSVFEENVERLSSLTEAYLAGYLKVMNTIKDIVLRNYILIVMKPGENEKTE